MREGSCRSAAQGDARGEGVVRRMRDKKGRRDDGWDVKAWTDVRAWEGRRGGEGAGEAEGGRARWRERAPRRDATVGRPITSTGHPCARGPTTTAGSGTSARQAENWCRHVAAHPSRSAGAGGLTASAWAAAGFSASAARASADSAAMSRTEPVPGSACEKRLLVCVCEGTTVRRSGDEARAMQGRKRGRPHLGRRLERAERLGAQLERRRRDVPGDRLAARRRREAARVDATAGTAGEQGGQHGGRRARGRATSAPRRTSSQSRRSRRGTGQSRRPG